MSVKSGVLVAPRPPQLVFKVGFGAILNVFRLSLMLLAFEREPTVVTSV